MQTIDAQTELNFRKLQLLTLQELVNGVEQTASMLTAIEQRLIRLCEAMERLAPQQAPDYQIPLERWSKFDWATIGATVELADNYGAAVVFWRGQQFQRRSPNNKFGVAVWYSRCTGKDERGENQYERLCTFKPVKRIEVEPLPEKVALLVR